MNWEFFSYESDPMLACPCGDPTCVPRGMDDTFMQILDLIRRDVGLPFRVNSGYRCPEYNSRISSTGAKGPHTTGRAIDIAAATSTLRLRIQEAALRQGFRRFGIGKTFIHLDNLSIDIGFPSGVWSY